MAILNISGYVLSSITSEGLGGFTVQLYSRFSDDTPIEYLALESTTESDGSFQFLVDDAVLASFFGSEPIQIGFRVSKGGIIYLDPAASVVWEAASPSPAELVIAYEQQIMGYNIFGNVRSLASGKGIGGLTVKIVKCEEPEIIFGTVTTKKSGFFQLVIDKTVINDTFSDTDIIRASFIVESNGNVLLEDTDSPIWTPDVEREIDIVLDTDDATYAPAIIYGNISFENGVRGSDIRVNIFQKDLDAEVLLVGSETDNTGNYRIEVSKNLLVDVSADNVSIIIKLVKLPGLEALSQSEVFALSNSIQKDFLLGIELTNKDTFEDMATRIGNVIEGGIIDIQPEQYRIIANVTKYPEAVVSSVVGSYYYASDIGMSTSAGRALIYAVVGEGINGTPFMGLNATNIEETVQTAIDKKIIADFSEDLPEFIEAVTGAKVGYAKATKIDREEYTMGEMLGQVMEPGNIDSFVMAYNERLGLEDPFDFYTSLNSDQKKGFNIMKLTTNQLETAGALKVELGEDEVYTLAEKEYIHLIR